LDRLFNPMLDNICPMSKNSSDRLFYSFDSVAEPCSASFLPNRPMTCLQRAGRPALCLRAQ
jgi:hypothetical protein